LGLDYVDIFYSHRFDPDTPLEETIGALESAVHQGKALYVGISSYSAERTREAVAIARQARSPMVNPPPTYTMLTRCTEPDVLDACGEEGLGIIAFSPLGQGMLTDRYLNGIPADSRAAKDGFLKRDFINDENMARIRGLNEIAGRRGQTLAAMALAWVLRDARVTSALIGASSVAQLEANVAAAGNLEFTSDELAEIDSYAVESGINIWQQSSDA
jgi:L-glyceraldehyde 3-phosphate reductase